jgi:hypothetical protein
MAAKAGRPEGKPDRYNETKGKPMKLLKKLLGKDKAAAPAKPAAAATRFYKSPEGIYVFELSGVLNKATVDRVQLIATTEFKRGVTNAKLMIVLKGFVGWKGGDDWGNLDFFMQYEHNIARIAVVGDARWQAEMQMFLGAGRRTGEVRFFLPGQEKPARDWLTK